ncbi:hypothetical protein MKX03_017827 [Papaver bracteatum]|nr:hypothetical protein MKX03_017827 [Papaver bracteatum]
MSTPGEYYRSLPPVCKVYGVFCFMTAAAYHLQLYPRDILLLDYGLVLKRFQIWRLVSNFFFLGPFSASFAVRLIMLARYGVQLEKGPFDKRTIIAAVPMLCSPFMAVSLVFMLLYVWSREFPNAQINIYGVARLKGFYLPWAMLALDLIFGAPLKPDILGIIAGHLYYFLTVLYPLSTGRNILKTPLWVYPFCGGILGKGTQINSPVQPNPSAGIAFRGRGRRLGGN